MLRLGAICGSLMLAALPAAAEFATVQDRATFVDLVAGRTLSRPMVSLRVSPDGAISGRGAVWDVTGAWTWREGYFCRDLTWGGDPLGYDCQAVQARGDTIRFVAEQGRGEAAEFTLR
ncbi:dihydrodipicolinate reductase [Citreimonas sp.]|uniref:dihydrodipicolinate reductase n=1 Tax=Citreimonas sp. TaxID=3036715 RepID=UPI0035C83281